MQVEAAIPGEAPTTGSVLTAFLPLTFMSDPTRTAALFAEGQLKKDAPATGTGEHGFPLGPRGERDYGQVMNSGRNQGFAEYLLRMCVADFMFAEAFVWLPHAMPAA